jgi:RNA polymerase sigma factor (sigma-70 family)
MAAGSTSSEVERRFNQIIEEHGRFLHDTIARLCPKDLGLDFGDIEQEARVRLWRAVENEKEILNPASYIYRIAVTTTIDAVRRIKARREEQLRPAEDGNDGEVGHMHPETDPGRMPDHIAARREVVRKIRETLAEFPPDRRRAVGLYLQGMTTSEIGDLLGWSEPKARNHVYRGLAELRHELRVQGIEYETE